MPHPLLLTLVSLCLVFRAIATAYEPPYTITRFNVLGTTYTTAFGINARGQIIGNCTDARFQMHGFRFDRATFTPIDPPGGRLVAVTGINAWGQVVGSYTTGTGVPS
jgi:probable HAF family extracellular repeat protein